MLKKLSNAWHKWSEEGMRWPFVHDPVKGKPSVTLLFFYLAFTIAILTVSSSSTMMIIKGQYLQATFMPLLMWFSAFVFYRLRRLDSVKINLQEQSVEIEGGEDDASKK